MKPLHVRPWAVAAALAFAITTNASAADLAGPVEPRVITAPLGINWTGAYAGINVGYGHSLSDWRFFQFDTINRHDGGGVIVGGQLGYNYQFANNIVLGFEGSASWADAGGRSTCPNPIFTCGTNTGIYADASLRIGYAFDRLLPYVKGGVAFIEREQFSFLNANPSVRSRSGPDVNIGYLVGAGVEYAVDERWSAKVEYNFIGFGDRSTGFVPPTAPIPGDGTAFFSNARTRGADHIIKVGLNYKF